MFTPMFALSCYKNRTQERKNGVAQITKLGSKSGNSVVYITRFCVNARVPHFNLADHVKKRGSSVKWNNASKGIRDCSYNLYFKIVVIINAEQINNGEPTKIYNVS
jgi:hypothetical protein